ncbi:DNA segregation protein PrgO (plasmid) [Paucilactobacillus suebicus]|uniref:Uncharacterized protein n=1 Tax=Paucilactobacillus suebicus DSM 5007 = KCTC 3549 TaxID=1423807 RepID=A0A0R1VU36_9LACO|nr:DNA segregation protein PrgO [Paucilactobacillus suebicus]KRM09280.1 hypothetical protein FD16_GL001868 [Paucilactobacillus suebicus DSM 5007 = KCTC 3549]
MALLKRDNNQQPNIKNTADISRNINLDKKYNAKDRKTIKVDPPVYELIKSMSIVTGMKMYDLVKDMGNVYLDERVSNRQKETILLMVNEDN